MDVLMVTAFVSLLLVVAGIILFVSRARAGDFEHGDRLSLLPLADDDGAAHGEGADDPAETEPQPVDSIVHPTRGGTV
jgi:hypothetical protein